MKPQQLPSHHLSAVTLLRAAGRNWDEGSIFCETNLHCLQNNQACLAFRDMKPRKSLVGVGQEGREASEASVLKLGGGGVWKGVCKLGRAHREPHSQLHML